MKQKDLGLDLSNRRTRKQILLDEMEQVMPWGELVALIVPHALCAVQYLDGQKQAFAEDAGMGSSANGQGARNQAKFPRIALKFDAEDIGVSTGGTYSFMTASQTQFWP
jgi:hypothetical protein